MLTYSSNSYQVDGQPVWLASGEMHYFKMPQGEWRRRLLQLKLAGFNTVSVYMPWNYHEMREGQWDFSGDKDVAAFLELAAEIGLYVIARPGPFICNEWQCGGIPPWLSAKKRIRLRTADPQYLAACDRWWEQIAPIIAHYQSGAHGSIILAQVENEYGHFGPFQEEAYIHHLRDGLRAHGVTIPLINCDSFIRFPRLQPRRWEGINLGCNFGGDGLRILPEARKLQPDAPLFVTEYWIAAFDWWGRNGSSAYNDDEALYGALEIAAGGAGGLTAFVFAGGAHFAYWHGRSICSDDNFMTTLYGPGAPILDDGSFGGKYPLFKTHFTGLMSGEAELAQAGMPEITRMPNEVVHAVRRGPKASFEFYLNQTKQKIAIADAEKEQAAFDMTIPAGAVQWTVRDLPLPGGFELHRTSAQLFCADPALVLYGQANDEISFDLACPGIPTWEGSPDIKAIALSTILHLTVRIPATVIPETGYVVAAGHQLRVLVTNTEAVSRIWRIDLPCMQPVLLGGPERIEDIIIKNDMLQVQSSASIPRSCWQVTADGAFLPSKIAFMGSANPFSLRLTAIECNKSLPEAQADFNDTDWFSAAQPQPMVAFDHGQGYAWYRTKFEVEMSGPQMIFFSGAADRALVFIDGQFIGMRGFQSHFGWNVMALVKAGTHTLAMLVENLGMFNTGAEMDIPMGEPKGLYGPVWLNGEEIVGWRMRAGLRPDEKLEYWPAVTEQPWTPFGVDTIHGRDAYATVKGPSWMKGQFTMPTGFDGAVRLCLGEHASKGSVWLNGHHIGRYWSIGPQYSLWLPVDWLREENTVVLFDEEGCTPALISIDCVPFGLSGEVSIPISRRLK